MNYTEVLLFWIILICSNVNYPIVVDLEIADLVNGTPTLNTRTPGQLLSLTSHLSFGNSVNRRSGCSGHSSKERNSVSTNLLQNLNKEGL